MELRDFKNQQKESKDATDFLVSYVVLRHNCNMKLFQVPLKVLFQYIRDSIEDQREVEANECETKYRLDDDVRSDSPIRPYRPIGNLVVKSSYSGRFKGTNRSEEVALRSTFNRYTSSRDTSSSTKVSTVRAPQRISSKLPASVRSPEAVSPDTAPSTTHPLTLKDLKRLDFQFSNSERAPTILIRRHCMVVSFGLIRSVVLSDQVILLCPASMMIDRNDSAFSYVTAFKAYVQDWSNDQSDPETTELPFEHHVLEGLLALVKTCEKQEYLRLNGGLRDTFTHFQQKGGRRPSVTSEVQFRNLKAALFDLRGRVAAYRECLSALVEDQEQMALMNLTYLQQRPHLYKYPFELELLQRHERVEDLIESDLIDFTNISHSVVHLETRVNNVEAMYHLQLNIVENMALRADTLIMFLLCSLAFSSFCAGVFGMNLDNTSSIQAFHGGFSLVFIASFVSIAVVFYSLLLCVLWSTVFLSLSPWRYCTS